MAPEILAEKRYAADVDWWSLGVTMYELIFGRVKLIFKFID
jgi:serine/threonine kinase 32